MNKYDHREYEYMLEDEDGRMKHSGVGKIRKTTRNVGEFSRKSVPDTMPYSMHV